MLVHSDNIFFVSLCQYVQQFQLNNVEIQPSEEFISCLFLQLHTPIFDHLAREYSTFGEGHDPDKLDLNFKGKYCHPRPASSVYGDLEGKLQVQQTKTNHVARKTGNNSSKTFVQTFKSKFTKKPTGRDEYLNQCLDSNHRVPRDTLELKGILKPNKVFGNKLSDMPKYENTDLPMFLVLAIKQLDTLVESVGLYRVNGDMASVQTLRFKIDHDDYECLKATKEPSLLASTVKLFFRELNEPLISSEVWAGLKEVISNRNRVNVIHEMTESLKKLEHVSYNVLKHFVLHLVRVAEEEGNKMNCRNLSVVITPNLIHTTGNLLSRRPESVIAEVEENNFIIETIIQNGKKIFVNKK